MTTKSCQSYWVKIYISGPRLIVEQTCREECLREGLCVTVDDTKFIYTGGEEAGSVIGLVDYPRFPKSRKDIRARANALALLLLEKTCQHSVLVMDDSRATWFTKRSS